jgi:hypothetical protein
MTAFEVHLNGKSLCTAGIGEAGVLTAIATWISRAVPTTGGQRRRQRYEKELDLRIGGLTHDCDGANVHIEWAGRPLRHGDEIRIKVVQVRRASRPRRRKRESPRLVEKQKRRYYEHLKREYGD